VGVGQTLSAGDLAIIAVSVDDEEFMVVALTNIPSGESIFFTDEEWGGASFNTGEGFYEWVTPVITAGEVITISTSSTSVGGTVTSRAGSFALGNSGDGVYIYQTSTNTYNSGTYTILGFAGEDAGDAGTLAGTGLTLGTTAIYFGGDNGIYVGTRIGQTPAQYLALIYGSSWTTSGTSQTFDTTDFTFAVVPSSNTITTGTSLTGSPFCVGTAIGGAAVSVPYTTSGTFNGGNIFTAQLSDASGSFASATSIGTGTSPISATIPTSITDGTGYRIRVVGSDPVTNGSDNGTNLVINNFAAPTSFAVSCGNATADVSWTNPGCFDDVMVVASDVAFTSATPSGTGYTADPSFTGSGTAFDGGKVVFKASSGTSETVTNLTNGTTYNFKIYARKGGVWVAGSTESCAPVAGPCGSETIDNASPSIPSSYSDGLFTGDNGVTWDYEESRNDGGYEITGEGIMLRNNTSFLETTDVANLTGGMADFTCKLLKGFTGGGNRQVELFVNGTSLGTSIIWDNTTVQTFTVTGINVATVTSIEIRNISTKQLIVDDIEWGCYAPTFPPVNLSVSASAGTEAGTTAITVTATADFAVTGAQTVDLTVTGTNITAGDYTLSGTSITIANGATTGSETFTVVDDALTETAETATLTISNESAGITLGGTTTQDIAITDNDAPIIVAAPTSLTGFSTPQGTASASQTFTLAGDNLSTNLSIAAVTGYEYSLDDITFTSTLIVPVSSGNVTGEPRTIYVRLTGATIGTPSGNAVVSGGGATSVNVALDGTVTAPPAAPCTDLFISEYVEGSSSNKYIEIYNPTASAINLGTGNYSLRLYSNGDTSPSSDNALSGTLAAYTTLVLSNSGASEYGGATTDNSSVNFNGDDAIALAKNGTNIDIFGRIGQDPGSEWSEGGNATADQTLVRNVDVEVGVDVNPTGTFTALATEWTEYSQDDVSDLGQHTCDCFVALPVVTLTSNTTTGTEAGTTQIILTATADVAVTGSQTVAVVLSGTGLASTDFTGVDFTTTVNITINGGATVGTVTFNVADDSDLEGSETATFTIGSPSAGVVVGTPNAADLTIADDDNVTSTESAIIGQGGEAASISSLTNGTITSNTEGTQVWQFNLYDGDGSSDDADSKPTIYEGFTIRQSGGNTVPIWDDAIGNVKFFLGASATAISGSFLVSPSTITFTPTTPITVADGTTPAVISMRLTLDVTLPSGSDGQHFGFSLDDSDINVETDVLLASQLGTFTEVSDAALNGIDITATLQFIDAPIAVSVGSNFSVTVSAVDANGNVDTSIGNSITLSLTSGAGTLTGAPVTANLTSGTHTFAGLSHDTEEIIQITVNDNASMFADLTANINITDEPNQLFDDFNRADNNTVGVPSSGGSTSWTEDGLFSNEAQRIAVDGNELYLGGCVAGSSSGSSGSTGMEQIRFNGETLYETTFDNAGGILEWLFNMRQTRPDPSGFGASTYAAAVVLGSDENDFKNVNADGYAVIIGNGSSPDPVKLIRFAGGLGTNVNVTDVAVSSETDADAYYSVKVTYDPCTGEWNLFVRDDGTSAFSAPNVGGLGSAITATDQTHTGLDLKYFGVGWQHSSSCGEYLRIDNLNIPNATTASTTAKVWNGSVNADWNEVNNWGPCPGAPTNTNEVIIPNVATQPIVSAATPAATCENLTLNTGATITINANRFLNVWGNVVNNGSAAFGDGTFVMEGSGSLSLTGNVDVANYHVSTTVTLNGRVTVSDIARSEAGGALAANGNLVLENGAQLLHGAGTTSGEGSVTGNIVVRRQGNGSGAFNAWSTPVVGGGLPGSNGYSYTSLLGTNSGTDDNNPDPDPGWVAHSGAMSAGNGYFSVNGGSAAFTGVANNGNYSPSVTSSSEPLISTDAPSFFNLIGNPYPSAIDADQFISDNSARIDGALYFWSDENAGSAAFSSDDYATYSIGGSVVPLSGGGSGGNPNGSIPSCQGFFVNCDVSGTIVFNNSQRGGSNNQFFRMAAPDAQRLWLSINNDELELFNQTLVAFDEFATDQKDWGVDAYKFRGNPAISIGAQQDNETYVIATYADIPQSGKVIPLMTYVETAATYTFVADSMEGFDNHNVFLEDLSNNSLYPMQQGDSYSFAMTSADEFNRFQLWFSPVLVTGVNETDNGLSIYATPDNMIVVETASGDNAQGTVQITDMAGRRVRTNHINVTNGIGRLQTTDLANGIYAITFVRADGNKRTSQKVALGQ